jgi:hypothetical protein
MSAERPRFESIEDPALRWALETMWDEAQRRRAERDAPPRRLSVRGSGGGVDSDDAIHVEDHLDWFALTLEEDLRAGDPCGPDWLEETRRRYIDDANLGGDELMFVMELELDDVIARAAERIVDRRWREAPPPDH